MWDVTQGGGLPVVTVVGLGYVGLPTALALADAGCRVVGCDNSEERIAAIKRGTVDLLDADLRRLRRCQGAANFVLTTDPSATAAADVVIVCVPTPVDDHQVPDLRALSAACADVVAQSSAGQTIVLTSTSYVGCTRDLIVEPLAARGLRAGESTYVAFSPERIDPGIPEHQPQQVPRVVGGVTQECGERAAQVLSLTASRPHRVSSPEAAEATKLLENTFRAVNIAFANEFADGCGRLGLDVSEIVDAAATKPYGFLPFRPGSGVGGHCIPCDPQYLLWQMRAHRVPMPVTETAMSANVARPRRVVARAREVLADAGTAVAGARVLVVGVAYKPDVSDVRESPALEIMADLAALGADVAFTDLHVEFVSVDGRELTTVDEPWRWTWDLVVLHTTHTAADHEWLRHGRPVLDATYRAVDLTARSLL